MFKVFSYFYRTILSPMSLEACVVCLDTSAFARDADLHPTRLAAQLDATSLLANAKLNAHRENAVGIVTMGGDRSVAV